MACGSLGAGLAFAAVGDLDPSFDADGVARTDLTGNSIVNDVAVQPDGRIVAAGNSDTAGEVITALTRYTATGALDVSFGGDGKVELDQAVPTPEKAVVVRPTGQILVAGTIDGSPHTMAVEQHLPNGDFDHSFASSFGFTGSSFGGRGADGNDVALEADGGAVMVGVVNDSAEGDNFAVLGITPDGSPPVTHIGGASGVNVAGSVGNAGGQDHAEAVAIDPNDGDIIVAGDVDPTISSGNDDNNIAVVRFTSAGVLDAGFSGDGIATVDMGDDDTAGDVAIQPDGKIVVTGRRQPVGPVEFDHFVLRLNSNGTPDTGFGGSGTGVFIQSAVSPNNAGNALARLPGGKIVVAGNTLAGLSDWVVARYTSAGLPDTSFDGDGSRTYSFPGEAASLSSLALQPDGKLVVGGAIGGDFAVGRLEADPVPPVVDPTPTLATPTTTPKKCKKGQKLKKGKCVKKKKK